MNNTQYQPNMRDKSQDMMKINKNQNDEEEAKFITLHESPKQEEASQRQHPTLPLPLPLPLPPLATSSTSSSPTHEFSFTISLQPQPPKINHDKTIKPSPFAIDLSPADDIFFHGHLLPLHLLSHLPVSPRSSTNSLDSFTLPIKDLLPDSQNNPTATTTSTSTNNINDFHQTEDSKKGSRIKSKSFSIFGLPKWRKGCEDREKEGDYPYKKKLRFDISHVLKRYARMVKPLLSFRGTKRSNMEFPRQPYSYSGNILSARGKAEFRRRRGESSAPASMRTSPTNSGILLATSGTVSPTKSTSDSTMEELQAAIQAAIAHCKNSIAVEDKIQCQED